MRERNYMYFAFLSGHVHAGEPHSQPGHPDYVPSVFPAVYKQAKRRQDQSEERYHRLQQRRLGRALQDSVREVPEQMEEPMDSRNKKSLSSESGIRLNSR